MVTVGTLWLALAGNAQDLDESDGKKARENAAAAAEQEITREVVRGYFLKSNIGVTNYLGTAGVPTSGVIALSLGVGSDFIDKERISASWEVDLQQALINGPRSDEISLYPPVIQGDLHVFNLLVTAEVSTYLTRRFGLGLRGGGGLSIIPLLMGAEGYQENLVDGVWGGVPALVHEGPLPIVLVSPTIEYYTKLSHFSVGAEADVSYTIGWDLGVTPTGYLKYTF